MNIAPATVPLAFRTSCRSRVARCGLEILEVRNCALATASSELSSLLEALGPKKISSGLLRPAVTLPLQV